MTTKAMVLFTLAAGITAGVVAQNLGLLRKHQAITPIVVSAAGLACALVNLLWT